MGLKFRNAKRARMCTTGMDESAPGAMVCAQRDVAWCVVVGCRPMPSLQSGCSCEPVIYFHLAVLARSLKENPMTIARRAHTYTDRERERGRKREREKEKERERGERETRGRLIPVPKARLCIGRKGVVFFIRTSSYSFWCTNELFLVTFIFHFFV